MMYSDMVDSTPVQYGMVSWFPDMGGVQSLMISMVVTLCIYLISRWTLGIDFKMATKYVN